MHHVVSTSIPNQFRKQIDFFWKYDKVLINLELLKVNIIFELEEPHINQFWLRSD